MDKDIFNKQLHICYLDEVKSYSFKELESISVVSLICPKEKYIIVERNWSLLRKKYNIPNGVCLHFTDIKALLNPSYFKRLENNRNPNMEKIFCTKNNIVDYDKLYKFYLDIFKFILSHDFSIQVTSSRHYKLPIFHDKRTKLYHNGYWYPLFRKHLDNMTYLLLKSSYDEYILSSKRNPKYKFVNKVVKLFYDGDFDLSVRTDFRDAYSHSISNGTERFQSKAFKELFDEIRFIDKSEVGYCVDSYGDLNISNHAGNEILDFIAVYAARDSVKDYWKNDIVSYSNKTLCEAKTDIEESLQIRIPLKPTLVPLNIIKNKIKNTYLFNN